MNDKTIVFFVAVLGIFLLTSFTPSSDAIQHNQCQYYSYVVYGEAMTNGQLKNLEPVYEGFDIHKSSDDFFACFNFYRSTTTGNFKVINIGPYDTELVIYQEINRIRQQLEGQGYKKAERFKHTLIAVLLYGDKKCE